MIIHHRNGEIDEVEPGNGESYDLKECTSCDTCGKTMLPDQEECQRCPPDGS